MSKNSAKIFFLLTLLCLFLLPVSSQSYDIQETCPEMYPVSSIRTDGIQGIRFKASVDAEQKQACMEYGFIATTKEHLTSKGLTNDALMFGADVPYSYGAAYDKISGIETDTR